MNLGRLSRVFPVSYVNVEPHGVLLANDRDRLNGIESAQDCGARGEADHEWQLFALDAFKDHALEFIGSQLAT